MLRVLFALAVAAAACTPALAGPRRPADRAVTLDAGVLRWADTREEVALFGVNYYPPCSLNYRDLKTLGADHERVTCDDIRQFVRLNLDLLRLHVWDREISDRAGSLLDNEHLRLLDFLVARCKESGIYLVLTPIAWWGTPNPSDGFSNHFAMHRMTTDPAAREAQRRYLAQFVRHRNRYTGLTYAEDPAIVAFELINEPLYPEGTTDVQVTAYIDSLADAVRATGCRKPIFYNGWQGRLDAVGRSSADGCTFGWYPTGLVAGHALRDDYLPRVQDYPSMRSPELAGKAVGVYEFDAADVPGSYLYPAMARAFRSGGAQFAAQFQYDPTPVAPFNAGWQTHYLNLAYTPRKAVSFLIASEAFHALPRRKTYGAYPQSNRFGEFRVSHAEDLSERVSETCFLHSNTTRTKPPAPRRLERIAGCGSSPLVSYEGTGAYFLDRLAPGAWRLEVYPDAVWVADPYARTDLSREVTRLYRREWPMRLSLPDLGKDFQVRPLPEGRGTDAADGAFPVRPGVYLLQRRGSTLGPAVRVDASFPVPAERDGLPPSVWHEPQETAVAGREVPVRAIVAAPGDPEVSLLFRPSANAPWEGLALRREAAYHYAGAIPGEKVAPGELSYCVVLGSGQERLVFPGSVAARAAERMVAPPPALLFAAEAGTAVPELEMGGAPGQKASAGLAARPGGRHAVRLTATGFGPDPSCAGLSLKAVAAPADAGYDTLVVRARALEPDTNAVELGLVQADGNAFGYDVPLAQSWRDVRIPLAQLKRLWKTQAEKPHPSQVESLRLTFGAWLYKERRGRAHGLEVERVWLERSGPGWRVRVHKPDAPILLLSGEDRVTLHGDRATAMQQATVGGKEDAALRVAVERFGAPPSCVSFRVDLSRALAPWRGLLAGRKGLRFRVRAGEGATGSVEVVLLERDGAPWGCVIPLTTEWQDVSIPWEKLIFFKQWSTRPGRGGGDDRIRPEQLESLNVCFGSWLFPERAGEPHAVEIEGVWVE